MNNYKVDVQLNFKMSSANAKPIMDSLEKQFKTRPLNLPVNFKFNGVNVNQITQYNNAFRTLNRTINQLGISSSKASANLATLTSNLSQVGATLGAFGQSSNNLKNFQTGTANLGTSLNTVGKNAGKATREVISFAESVGVSTRRFASFGVAASVIATTSIAIRRAIGDALDFDRELVRLKQVGGDSDNAIAGIEKTITKLGTSLGVSSKDMSTAAVTLRQAGLSAQDTSKALEVLGKTTLSPTFEDLKSTTEGLIAVFNQFGGGIDALESQFGAISKVSADYAVESSDLVEAVKRAGGAFKAAGGNLNQLLAMFTTIRSTTRESAESIATGMRTIISRLQDPTIARKLHNIGVEVYDLKGQFVGPLEAINRLSDALKKIPKGDIRASNIIKDIGGLRQLSRVIPLIYNPELTKKALDTANSGANKLSDDARVAQEALLVQLSKIKEGFLDLFRVIATDSSTRTVLSGIISGVQTLTNAMRELKPLVPVFLAFAAVGTLKYGLSHVNKFRKGVFNPVSGYAEGGTIGPKVFKPKGTDTIPAMLSPGEYVVNKDAAQSFGYSNLEAINRRTYKMNRIRSKYSMEAGYGVEGEYANLGEYLLSHQLEHKKNMYQIMGNPFMRKSPGYEKLAIGRHKSLLKGLINEQRLYKYNIPITPFSLNNASELIRKAKDSTLPTAEYGIQHFAKGGMVYMANGGIPEKGSSEYYDYLIAQLNAKKRAKAKQNFLNPANLIPENPIPYGDPDINQPTKLEARQKLLANREISPITLSESINNRISKFPNVKSQSRKGMSLTEPFIPPTVHPTNGPINFSNEELPSLPGYDVLSSKAREKKQRNLRNIKLPVIQPGSGNFSEDVNRAYVPHIEGIYPFNDENKGRVNQGPINAPRRESLTHFNGMMESVGAMSSKRIYGVNRFIGEEKSKKNYHYKAKDNMDKTINGNIIANSPEHAKNLLEYKGISNAKVKETLSSKLFGAKDTSKNLYKYTHMDESGNNALGTRKIFASSENAAKSILQGQGKFITSIKQVDNTFSNRVFPTLSKWLTGTTKSIGGVQTKTGGLLGGIKKIGPGALLAASLAAPIVSEHIFGTREQPGQFGKTGAKIGSVISGVAGGAAAGAFAGSTIAPGVGTAIGALGGAALGAVSALKQFSDEVKEANLKEFMEDIKNIKVDRNQNLTSEGRSTVNSLLAKGFRSGSEEKYGDLSDKVVVSTKDIQTKGQYQGGDINVGKHKALEMIPEEQRNAISDTVRSLVEAQIQKNPGKSYKDVIGKVGNFKLGDTEYGAGEVLGLNKKNTEEVQKNIIAQNKAFSIQEKMNALLGQINQELGMTAAQLESFANALEKSGDQYELRSNYSQVGTSALAGQITSAPSNVGLNNLGGKGTIAGELHSFSSTGGGYDQSRQALLQIVQAASQQKLGNMDEQEAAISTGTKAGSAFRGTGSGGQYNEQIADMTEHVIGNTTKLQETVQKEGLDKVVDQILAPFKNIKDTGKSSEKNLQSIYAKQQQEQVNKYNRNFELRQQSVSLTGNESEATNQAYLRTKTLKPEETFSTSNRSKFMGGSNRASTIARNRVVSQPEAIANDQLNLQVETFRRQQSEFGAGGLTGGQISSKYKGEENKLGGLLTQRQQAVKGGAGINVIKVFDDQILKTQDNMRNYATALKNLADNTGILEAAQKKYENAVGQFTADYESRKKDADVLAFGSRDEKMQLAQKENITQQALSMDQGQFANLPDQIKKIVFERLQETQGQVRTVQKTDKYGRNSGTIDVTGEEALQKIRQPYLNQLAGTPTMPEKQKGKYQQLYFNDLTGDYQFTGNSKGRGKYKKHYENPLESGLQNTASNRLRGRAQEAGKLVDAATGNKLDAQRESLNLNQNNANKQTVQGEDNFQKYLSGINQSIAQQMQATEKFLAGSAELTKALNSFSGKLSIERSGRVEVIINGMQALQAIKGDLQVEIMEQIKNQLSAEIQKEMKKQPVR